MRKWLWIAPMLVAAGCSRDRSAERVPMPTAQPQAQQTAGSAQSALAAPADPSTPVEAAPVAEPPAPPPVEPDTSAPPASTQAVVTPANAVIPSGTSLRVRVDESISTRRNMRGDHFTATLVDPVVVNGRAVLPRGTRLGGHVLVASASGRFKGRARIVLALDSFNLGGRRYTIGTTAASRVSGNHKKRNLIAIGGGSGVGAAIGAIASGGTGALIGAGAGAAAGTVGAAVTGKKQVTIPAESVVRFTLDAPVRV